MEQILNNKVNKQKLVFFLSKHFEQVGSSNSYAKDDAAVLIVQTYCTVASAWIKDTQIF